jgi:hypothetical protein
MLAREASRVCAKTRGTEELALHWTPVVPLGRCCRHYARIIRHAAIDEPSIRAGSIRLRYCWEG